MEERLNRIEDKLDKLVEVQTAIQIDVAEHIRRTALAEENIQKLAQQMQPVQEHVAFIKVSGKLLMGLAAIAAAVTTIWQLFGGKQ